MFPGAFPVLFGQQVLDPRSIASLAAWYDVSLPASTTSSDVRIDSSNRVSLVADKSGNSAVNCLCFNGTNSNFASLATGNSIGTGVFTLVADFRVPPSVTAAAYVASLSGSTNNGGTTNNVSINLESGNNGTLRVRIRGNPTSNGNILDFYSIFTNYPGQRIVVSVVRDTTGDATVYINGVAQTPSSITTNGTPPTWQGSITATYMNFGVFDTTNYNWVGAIYGGRVYTAALSASAVAADYAGTVQANNIVDVSFAGVAKLASSFTCTSGQTVTINSSGDLGARISGERDLVQLTAAKQPIYLQHTGTNYGYLNGGTNTRFTTPDSVAVSVTGDADFRAYLNCPDWTPSASQTILARRDSGGGSGQWSYQWTIQTNGKLQLDWTTDGSTGIAKASTVAPTVTDGTALWVRVTLDVDNGAGGNTVTFYTGTDGVNWTQLGDPVVTAGTTSIFDGTSSLEVGANRGGSNLLIAKVYRAQVYNGIGGTVVADFNPALYSSGTTFTASTGEVWTLNSQATIVTRTCLYFDGSDDYMKAASFSLSQPETVYFAGQQVSWTLNDFVLDGNSSDTNIWKQTSTTPGIVFYAGASLAQNNNWTIGTTAVACSVANSTSSLFRVNRTAATTGNGGSANMNGFVLGAHGDSGNPGNITTSGICIYNAAHDVNTQNRLVQYFGNKWGISV